MKSNNTDSHSKPPLILFIYLFILTDVKCLFHLASVASTSINMMLVSTRLLCLCQGSYFMLYERIGCAES